MYFAIKLRIMPEHQNIKHPKKKYAHRTSCSVAAIHIQSQSQPLHFSLTKCSHTQKKY